MPYLPPAYLEDTTFPTGVDMDVLTQLRLMAEKWRRFFPVVDYYSLNKSVTVIDHAAPAAASPDRKNLITGAAGTTQFDTLYREHVPAALHATGWQQPHSSAPAAAEEEVYRTPVPLHMRFHREPSEAEIKKYGFDKIRDILALVPTILFDTFGVMATEGDKFTHAGIDYLVVRSNIPNMAYWKNTSIPLYVALDCEHKRKGD